MVTFLTVWRLLLRTVTVKTISWFLRAVMSKIETETSSDFLLVLPLKKSLISLPILLVCSSRLGFFLYKPGIGKTRTGFDAGVVEVV